MEKVSGSGLKTKGFQSISCSLFHKVLNFGHKCRRGTHRVRADHTRAEIGILSEKVEDVKQIKLCHCL